MIDKTASDSRRILSCVWSSKGRLMLKTLFKDNEEGTLETDSQIIDLSGVTDTSKVNQELIKHSRLCYQNAIQGKLKSNLCYTITNIAGFDPNAIQSSLADDYNITVEMQASGSDSKVAISYDKLTGRVVII